MVGLALDLATVWTGLLLMAVAGMTAARMGTLTRALAVDTLAMLAVGLLALLAYARHATGYLDLALVLALLVSLGTLAVVRYHRDAERAGDGDG